MTKGTKRGIGTNPSVSRRSVLQAGIGAAGLAATGGSAFPSPAIAQAAGFDWKRFKGQHLEVLMAKGPRGDLLQQYRKEFEELTGMTVGDEQVPEQQQRQKTAIEFNSGNTSFDVVMIPIPRAEGHVRQEQVVGRSASAARRSEAHGAGLRRH